MSYLLNNFLNSGQNNYKTNLHQNFINFERAISLSSNKKQKLIASRQALQKKIIEHFKFNKNLPVPKFYIQGSYKMKTMVLDKQGEYDVDLGVYFLTKPIIQSFSLKSNVFKAVEKHTTGGAENKDKCVRVKYKGDFDIDLPVYYKQPTDAHPFLATKTTWLKSDPKELCDWFEKKKDKNGQLVRLVKYFKYWANMRAKKMPSGIALTILVTNNFKPHQRDDLAFFNTGKAILDTFPGFLSFSNFSVRNPATPNDNLIEKLDGKQIENFKAYLTSIITDMKVALEDNNRSKSIHTLSKHFGNKFV
jgi:hypothetical protein